jgi:hypothetical protein
LVVYLNFGYHEGLWEQLLEDQFSFIVCCYAFPEIIEIMTTYVTLFAKARVGWGFIYSFPFSIGDRKNLHQSSNQQTSQLRKNLYIFSFCLCIVFLSEVGSTLGKYSLICFRWYYF